jgi:lysophospholipase L1-like esterase
MAISNKSCHPIYQGEQKYAWDALKLMGAKHIYTFFGINDLYAGVESTVEKYLEFIAKVRQEIPDIRITIISTTPMYKGSEKKNLNNANIRALNAEMEALAAENGWGYVDIASRLCDSEGCLAKQYCSDSYVHETGAAYKIWQAALEEYAEAQLADASAGV